ncbi:MAG TPA: hypothetical protein DEO32_01210 [Ruminococcaceae bacterium]|nr:hypothetical protein [Oscillospiraceae bacterium]
MASDKPTLPITRVLMNLMYSFPKLVLTNLLFGVPLAAFFAIFYMISLIPGLPPAVVMLIRLITIIPAFPFYAGVVQVTAHLVRGERDFRVAADFFAAVKENFARFLVHGTVLFAAVIFSYLSIVFYAAMLPKSPIMFMPMIISILVAVFMLFMFFYLPSMTVTFDMPMKSIYKNSFLMSFGELKKNIIALLGLLFLFVISSTFLFACMGNPTAIMIVTAVLVIAIIPSVASFIINSAVYERMYNMVIDNSEAITDIDQKIAETEKKREPKKLDTDSIKNEFNEKLKSFEIDENADGDEYLFFEGRMLKRSVLLKMKQEVIESELK